MKRNIAISITPDELQVTKAVVGLQVFDNRMSEVLFEFLMFLSTYSNKDYRIVYKSGFKNNLFNIERFDIYSEECRLMIKIRYGI